MIKCTAIGYIGKDASLRVEGANKVVNFSVAIDLSYTGKNGVKVDKTQWLECSYWKDATDTGKLAGYLKKGTQVYIEGTPEVNPFTTKAGEAAASLKLKIQRVELLGSQRETKIENANAAVESLTPHNTAKDDLPF